ncbi:MAG: HlyD family secretion protein [Acidiferrobacteraceae bacterium]|jgi:membrane fusion protein (multidrug efflux system)
MRKKILMVAGAVVVGGLAIWGYHSWSQRYPSTEDAYIGANVVRVAPRVSGRVTVIDVVDQQEVKKGDTLYAIDPEPFRLELQQAQARLDQAHRQVAQMEAAVASARAQVNHREVLLENAAAKEKRAQQLAKKNYLSKQSVEDTEAAYKGAQADLRIARAKLDEARRQLGTPGKNNDRIVEARAAMEHAQWALDNTKVTAACNGQIGELGLRPGTVVRADTDSFVLVCDSGYWVDANFKETDLERIRPGQVADVKVDMYPGVHMKGVVESVSAAAGSAFSLLPPQNASGNWVKVTQRVPVRVRIDNPNPSYPLRVGTSAVVTIDTQKTDSDSKVASNSAPQ